MPWSSVPELQEYAAVVEKVDGFVNGVMERRADAFACQAGCSGCCGQELSVGAVEARVITTFLEEAPDVAQAIRLEEPSRREHCAFLDSSGRCSIYPARPLVCRTQGLPLRYAVVPESALTRDRSSDEVTWCPLNFREVPEPEEPDILDAERVNALLAIVEHRYCASSGASKERQTLRDLAKQTSRSVHADGRRSPLES